MSKKIIVALMSLLFICLIVTPAFADTTEVKDDEGYNTALVVDNADLLTDEEELKLTAYLSQISNLQSMDVVVLTENQIGSKTPEKYADDYYDYNGYGQGDDNSGCLLLISMADRDWHVSTTGYAITAITDYGIYVIEQSIVSYLSSGDYYDAFLKYGSVVNDLASEAHSGTPYDINHEYTDSYGDTISYDSDSDSDSMSLSSAIIISLICAVIITLIILGMIKSSYKPVRFQRTANSYLVDGSLTLRAQSDTYLYTHTTKTKIESESHSGGGSSTHTSSSGTSHGGGGGKF